MSDRFTVEVSELPEVLVVTRKPRTDDRGFFERVFCDIDLGPIFAGRVIRQINRTMTRRVGALRGMHFQRPPHAEAKFISCVRGEVYDVAVDIRRNSPSFLRWFGIVLSASNARSIFIPEGFAHGFQVLSADSELLYMHTHPYNPEAEAVVNALDPKIGINWPLPIADLSSRDRAAPFLDNDFAGV